MLAELKDTVFKHKLKLLLIHIVQASICAKVQTFFIRLTLLKFASWLFQAKMFQFQKECEDPGSSRSEQDPDAVVEVDTQYISLVEERICWRNMFIQTVFLIGE